MTYAPSGIATTNITHGCFRQLCIPVLRSTWHRIWVKADGTTVSNRCALFFHHVVSVVLMSAKKQVIGADTSAVVARVANEQSIGDGAVGQFPGQTMGGNHSSCAVTAGTSEHSTVAVSGNISYPQPTVTGSVNFRPEPFVQGLRRGAITLKLEGHHNLPLWCRAGAVSAVPGVLLALIIAYFPFQSLKINAGAEYRVRLVEA
jgi:hypothetical protein